ncbi:FRG domain-containing protein [Sphingomonas olei]|uniref:FRG domain-containing protein n=1 Tax=Sphingomonas olei TaxID=1886787 RepID=UPI0014555AC8|nr:FRG domain-containing protein [Sphingomonas olei]
MPNIVEHKVDTFGALLAKVEEFQNGREQSWYRGTGNSNYSLVPSIGRRQPAMSEVELSRVEREIANTFAQRAPPFVEATFTSEWKTLFFMQHYGIPTRLLDWSESPFVALYFALTSVKRDVRGKAANDVAVWSCDPVLWNRTALAHITFKGGILDEYCEEIKAYSPTSDLDQRATIPLMIYGTHNSPRIVAQRGVFALFGKGSDGMEVVYKAGSFPHGSIEKLIIAKDKVDEMLSSLFRKGFAESTIYPDLSGLSLEIKRRFGFY